MVTASNASKTPARRLPSTTRPASPPRACRTATASVRSSLASSGAAATAGVGQYAIVASNAQGSGLSNYNVSYVNGALTVNQATLTVTAGNQAKTYGTNLNLGSTAFTTTGTLYNGDTLTSATLTSSGAAATANVAGSPYAIVASNAQGSGLGNYAITYVNGSLTVNQAALTVTASNQSKTYGTNLNLGSSAFTNGTLYNGDTVSAVTLSSTGAAGTANVTGSPYAIVASNATGSGLRNYAISYVNGSLTVNQAALTVTAGNQSKTYGTNLNLGNSAFTTGTLYNGDTVNAVTLASTGAAGTANVTGSPYAIVASNATGSGLSNYAISYVNGALTVNQAALTVTAGNQSKIYGTNLNLGNSAFTTGTLYNGDTVNAVTLASTGAVATASVTGSPYAIVASNAQGSGLGNYAITYVNGALTVNQAALTVAAGNQSKTYGSNLNLGSSAFTTTGTLYNGDTLTSATLSSSGAATTANVTGSPYAIVASNAQGSGLGNYAISYVNGALTVNQATLTVAAGNQSKTYGTNLNLGSSAFTTSGTLYNGDTLTSATLTSSGSAATASVAGSPYAIVASNAMGSGLSNYAISYVSGSLTVNQRPITVTADPESKLVGAVDPALTYQLIAGNLVGSDQITGALVRTPGEAVGAYAINQGTLLASNNYALTYVGSLLTIRAASQTATTTTTTNTHYHHYYQQRQHAGRPVRERVHPAQSGQPG